MLDIYIHTHTHTHTLFHELTISQIKSAEKFKENYYKVQSTYLQSDYEWLHQFIDSP
jgi:hypothetical protein